MIDEQSSSASKLILIHGNGLSEISKKISEIKKSFDPIAVTEVSSKDEDLDQALIKISTPQLFSERRLVILEDFEKIEFKNLADDSSLTIILKYSKQLPANNSLLKEAQKLNAQIINFEEKDEKLIFPFLDSLSEKQKKAWGMFERLYGEFGGQYLLTMIFYMLRRLVLKTKRNLPSFVLQKIERQKRNFSIGKIRELYKFGLETDFKIKNGLLEEKMGLTLVVEKILTI